MNTFKANPLDKFLDISQTSVDCDAKVDKF